MRAAAILIFDKCLYLRGRLRLTTARRLSAYIMLHVVESASDDYSFYFKINLFHCFNEQINDDDDDENNNLVVIASYYLVVATA